MAQPVENFTYQWKKDEKGEAEPPILSLANVASANHVADVALGPITTPATTFAAAKRDASKSVNIGDVLHLYSSGTTGSWTVPLEDCWVVSQKVTTKPGNIPGRNVPLKPEEIVLNVVPLSNTEISVYGTNNRVKMLSTTEIGYKNGVTKATSGEKPLLHVLGDKAVSAVYKVDIITKTANSAISSVTNVFGIKGGKKAKGKSRKSKKGGKKRKTLCKK
jgi:PPE-repeat protein